MGSVETHTDAYVKKDEADNVRITIQPLVLYGSSNYVKFEIRDIENVNIIKSFSKSSEVIVANNQNAVVDNSIILHNFGNPSDVGTIPKTVEANIAAE